MMTDNYLCEVCNSPRQTSDDVDGTFVIHPCEVCGEKEQEKQDEQEQA